MWPRPQEGTRKMKKWEYRQVAEVSVLNDLGSQGWRVIATTVDGYFLMEPEVTSTEVPKGGPSPTQVALDEEAGGR